MNFIIQDHAFCIMHYLCVKNPLLLVIIENYKYIRDSLNIHLYMFFYFYIFKAWIHTVTFEKITFHLLEKRQGGVKISNVIYYILCFKFEFGILHIMF
jgi:hypothetical protein